jgi:hypothetical protein
LKAKGFVLARVHYKNILARALNRVIAWFADQGVGRGRAVNGHPAKIAVAEMGTSLDTRGCLNQRNGS